jgi:transcriptional regulator with XRE-family HTH domain
VTIKTEGQRRLLAWRGKNPERTQEFIGEKLGINQSAVSAWCRGTSRPEPHFRQALKLLAGIPEDSWETREETKLRETAIRKISGVDA